MKKKWFPIVVAFASIVAIVAILIIRGGISDGVRYIASDDYVIAGCELDVDASYNDLVVESIEKQNTSKFLVGQNAASVCAMTLSEIRSFQIGFYKQYLISLVMNGESILTREEGEQAYKASTSTFIFGIILFNLIGGLLVLISSSLRSEN